jgi:hypothetical protein
VVQKWVSSQLEAAGDMQELRTALAVIRAELGVGGDGSDGDGRWGLAADDGQGLTQAKLAIRERLESDAKLCAAHRRWVGCVPPWKHPGRFQAVKAGLAVRVIGAGSGVGQAAHAQGAHTARTGNDGRLGPVRVSGISAPSTISIWASRFDWMPPCMSHLAVLSCLAIEGGEGGA